MASQGMMRILHAAIYLGAVSCIVETVFKFVKARLDGLLGRSIAC